MNYDDFNYDDYEDKSVNLNTESTSINLYDNPNFNNNEINNNPPEEEKKPSTRKRRVLNVISAILMLGIFTYITLMVLSSMKLIRLPWIDYPEVLNLSRSEVVLKRNTTYQLTSSVYPSQVPYGKIIYESSNPDVVSVNQISGYLEAKKNGVAKVTAKLEDYDDILDTCEVVVSDNIVFIERVIVTNGTVNMLTGHEQSLNFTYEPNSASVQNFVFSSSDESIASVSEKGVVKALKKGTAIITITDLASNVSATQVVNVFDGQKIDKVEVSTTKVNLVVDGTIQLTATVKPDSANQNITWSSVNDKIATVTSSGLVTGVNYGSTKIIATAVDGTNAVVDVNVQEKTKAVESVSIDQSDLTIDVGISKKLTATIKPTDATDQTLIWNSSAPNVVAINSNGNIKGLSAGTAKITVKTKDGGFTDSINVTVKQGTVIKETDIKLSVPKTNLYVGKSITIDSSVVPSNATFKELTWTSSNTNVAAVSNGTIYGKGEGTAIIKVTSHHGITKSLMINVSAIKVTNITLSDSKRKINIGEEYALIARITPSDATNKKVTWTSSDNSIISVNEKGVVTPHKVGTATVTATTNNGKKASCSFTVTNEAIMPTSVSISKSQIEVKENGKVGLTAVVQPSNATNQKVTWSIENSNLATINEQGIIQGISDGITRVTAKTVNGKTSTAYVVIKTNNNTKYNYLNGTTIKYWIENNKSKNAYITHIWVKDAYNQFATMLPAKYPGLATAKTLMGRVASKYPNKAAVAVNASSFVTYNSKTGSGFNTVFAKSDKRWINTTVTPIVISDGVVKRDFTSEKMIDSGHYTYVMRNTGWIYYYSYPNGSDIATNKATTQKIKNDGVKNTFGFHPVLVRDQGIGNQAKGKNGRDIRQSICQIDKNNFILYTNISNDRSKGFSFDGLAKLMLSDKCVIGFNLDGGGSTNLLYKPKNSTKVVGVRTTSRSIGDIIYFYGD